MTRKSGVFMRKKPDKLNEDDKKRKEELLKKLESYKDSSTSLSEDELKDILQSLDEIITIEDKETPLIKKLGGYLLHLLLKYMAVLVSLLLICSLFMSHLVIDKILVFAVASIVAIPLTIINAPHLFGVDLASRGFITKLLVAIALLIVVMCLCNSYAYEVFKFNLDWVCLLVLSEGLFLLIDYFLATRVPFY